MDDTDVSYSISWKLMTEYKLTNLHTELRTAQACRDRKGLLLEVLVIVILVRPAKMHAPPLTSKNLTAISPLQPRRIIPRAFSAAIF